MTDPVTADNIYLKPLTVESIEEILKKHKIDAVLPTMGGQTALNLAIECEKLGIWKEHGVRMIGVDTAAIDITENREHFRALMERIGIPMAESKTVTSFLEGKQVAQGTVLARVNSADLQAQLGREVARAVPRLFLAGGLSPENVADAIAAVAPYGVDVCSAVEAAPGRKSAARMKQFVDAVRSSKLPDETTAAGEGI